MAVASSETPVPKKPRRWWRFFLQFSLRSLLLLTTLAAVGCWWFLQPPTREEELAGKHLKLRRQVRIAKTESPAGQPIRFGDPFPNASTDLTNVGAWRLIDEQGDPLVVGRYYEGQPQGQWTVYHTSGRKAAEGSVIHGARNGLWKTWDPEGRRLSEVTYIVRETKSAAPVLSRVVSSPRGYVTIQEAANAESVRHGPARSWYHSGRLKFEGNYAADRKDGAWTYYDERGGVTAKGSYRQDRKEGRWQERAAVVDGKGGQLQEIEYVAGRTRAAHDLLMARLQQDLLGSNLQRQVAVVDELESLGTHGVPLLLTAVDQPDANVRVVAVRALERMLAGPAAGTLPVKEILAKVEPLIAAKDERLSRLALLLAYRARPDQRARLSEPFLAALHRTSDRGQQQRMLLTMMQLDAASRPQLFAELAAVGELESREAEATTWRFDRPYLGSQDCLEFALELEDELPALLTAATSPTPEARCFVLRVIDRLARRSPAETVTVAGKGGKPATTVQRHPVPAAYVALVQAAESDADQTVRRQAANVGRVPMPVGGVGASFGTPGFF